MRLTDEGNGLELSTMDITNLEWFLSCTDHMRNNQGGRYALQGIVNFYRRRQLPVPRTPSDRGYPVRQDDPGARPRPDLPPWTTLDRPSVGRAEGSEGA